jgi:TetR/AcrR family transcriptional regulator, transcriptional repressor for nem operon
MSAVEPRGRRTKRDDLLDAAKELLWELGYENMSPQLVMEKSGAGQGSLYHHFGSKLELARVALQEVSESEVAAIDHLFALNIGPIERIEKYLKTPRDPFKGCRLGRLLHENAVKHDELRIPIKAYLDRIEEYIARNLKQGQRDGNLQPQFDPKRVAAALVACVQGAYHLARARQDPTEMVRTIRGALALLDGLKL